MIPDETPPAGHNQPPSPVEALVEAQQEALQPFEQRRDEIVASARRVKVTDRLTAGDAGDVIRIANDVFKRIDQDRLERTNPYRQAADAAKGCVDTFWQPVTDALDDLRARLEEWSRAEDERIAAQKREQDEAIAAMRQQRLPTHPMPHVAGQPTTAPKMLPAKPRKIRGDLGSVVSTSEQFDYRVIDVKKVPDWILNSQTVHEAIIRVVKSAARHLGDIDGIERTASTSVSVR